MELPKTLFISLIAFKRVCVVFFLFEGGDELFFAIQTLSCCGDFGSFSQIYMYFRGRFSAELIYLDLPSQTFRARAFTVNTVPWMAKSPFISWTIVYNVFSIGELPFIKIPVWNQRKGIKSKINFILEGNTLASLKLSINQRVWKFWNREIKSTTFRNGCFARSPLSNSALYSVRNRI